MLNNYASIIILNGSIPPQFIIDELDWNKSVIAADGALSKAIKRKLKADYLVGDLDSTTSSEIIIPSNIETHHHPDQNSCDFEKCIAFVRSKNLTPSLIIGINGGEIDHIINNINVMAKHHCEDGEFFFLDANEGSPVKFGMVLTKSRKFRCDVGKIVSIFPLPEAMITTKGLQYPLRKSHIHQSQGVLCARNKADAEEIEIEMHQGMALVVIDT